MSKGRLEAFRDGVLWARLHLLCWLSHIPFVTAWAGGTRFAAWPVALYGLVMLLAGFAYRLLAQALVEANGREPALAQALGSDVKGWTSPALYAAAVPLAFVNAWLAAGLYVVVALIWFIPDRRIDRALGR
jgi:uncharacterized membrane protein